MSKHRPIHRGHDRATCRAESDLLGALVQPSLAEAQGEAYRDSTRAAMLREFDRASAPQREAAETVEPETGAHVVTVEGITLTSLERIEEPEAKAATVRAIIARHRATIR